MTSFLQSQQWAEFQKSIGREVFDFDGIKVIKHPLPFGKNWLYIPGLERSINQIPKTENTIFIKAEPMKDDIAQMLVRIGFKKSYKNIQPHKTVVLDLTLSENELLGSFHHKTRYNIHVAEKHGIKVKQEKNINAFWELMQRTTKRDLFKSYSKDYYLKLLSFCDMYIAEKDDAPIAAAIILTHGDTAYYLHGASDHNYRAFMAPYALHWAITLNLKLLNFKRYDLWGIDSKRWPGVTRFKLGWGGRQIEYPGAFDFVLSKFWYLIYNLAKYVL